MTEEIWKDITGFEGKYQISNLGRVKSLLDKNLKHRELIIKQHDMFGYKYVDLYSKHSYKRYRVHRLVLLTFVGDSKLQVNHINGIKSDNRLCNLEYVTQSENMKHAYRLGLEKPCDNGFKKPVVMIKNNIRKIYPSIREMCRENNFDRRTVIRILNKVPSHISHKGYKFEFI